MLRVASAIEKCGFPTASIVITGFMAQAKLVRVTRGAVMDVAMSIASACWELRELNPDLPRKALFRSGMNIGQDAMGTMANTLILAFAGSSLNTLLLFQIFDRGEPLRRESAALPVGQRDGRSLGAPAHGQ